ncbi:hypothetical protein ACOMHN_037869 [Nucella lapillus]
MKSEEIQALLSSLQSATISDKHVSGTLQKIRSNAMATKGGNLRLVKLGCVPRVLRLLYRYVKMEKSETKTEREASENTVNKALSIVANLLTDKGARQQVSRFELETIVKLLNQCSSEEVKIRCCRSLSNLAMDQQVHQVMAEDDTIMALLAILDVEGTESKNPESTGPPKESSELKFPSGALIEAACKTLKQSFGHRGIRHQLINMGVVRRLAVLTKSQDSQLLAAVLKTLAELFTKRNERIIENMENEFPRAGVVPKVMELVDSENSSVSQQALSLLLQLAEHVQTAALLGMSNGIDFCLSHVGPSQDFSTRKKLISCMCWLARDAGNRDELLQSEALKIFLTTLQDDDFVDVHDQVLICLDCFHFDPRSLTYMLKEGLMPVLLTHLQRLGRFTSDFTVDAYRSAVSLLRPATNLPLKVKNSEMEEEDIPSGLLGSGNRAGRTSVTRHRRKSSQSEAVVYNASFNVSQTNSKRARQDPPCDTASSVDHPQGPPSLQSQPAMETESSVVEARSSSGFEDKGAEESGPARSQTYSMNSPSYQAEATTWRMEDYHPGVTCKSYSSATSPGSVSEGSGSPSLHSPLRSRSYPPSYSASSSPCSSLTSSSPYSSPGLSPGLSSPGLSPGLSSPCLSPGLSSPGLSPSSSGDCISLWSSGGESSDDLMSVGVGQQRSPDPALQQHDSMFADDLEQGFVFSSSEDDDTTENSRASTDCSAVNRRTKLMRKALFHLNVDGTGRDQGSHAEQAVNFPNSVSQVSGHIYDQAMVSEWTAINQGCETGQRFFRKPDSEPTERTENRHSKMTFTDQFRPCPTSANENSSKRRQTMAGSANTTRPHPGFTHSKILSLLSELSYLPNVDQHFATGRVIACLTDYLALAERPIHKCEKILSRILFSPCSLPNLLHMCAPAIVVRSLMLDSDLRLVRQADLEHEDSHTLVKDKAKVGIKLLRELSSQVILPFGQGVISFTFSRMSSVDQLMCAASLLLLHKHWSQEKRQKFLIQTQALDKVLTALCKPRTTPGGDDAASTTTTTITTTTTTIIKDVLSLALICQASDLVLLPRYRPADVAYFLRRALENLHPDVEESATAFLVRGQRKESEDGGEDCQGETDGKSEGEKNCGQCSSAEKDVERSVRENCPYERAEKDLRIVVREGGLRHVLHASRETLVNSSSVFGAMLQGGYVEAQQSEIVVEGVCAEAMTTVLHYLHFCDGRCPSVALNGDHDWVRGVNIHNQVSNQVKVHNQSIRRRNQSIRRRNIHNQDSNQVKVHNQSIRHRNQSIRHRNQVNIHHNQSIRHRNQVNIHNQDSNQVKVHNQSIRRRNQSIRHRNQVNIHNQDSNQVKVHNQSIRHRNQVNIHNQIPQPPLTVIMTNPPP